VLLTVSDTGHGIDAETIDHVFEPFFTTKPQGKGTGLGLATVYGLVRQHGGDISVRSTPGRGTTFSIHVPAVADAPEQGAPAQIGTAARGGTETVLVAEDEPIVRHLVRNALARHGYTVLESSSAEDALRLAAEHEAPIDLLLTDVIMPQLNGRELYARVSELHPGISALYISGYAGEVIATQGVLDAGIELLQKPFSVHDLLRRVRAVLDERTRRSPLAASASSTEPAQR
jgi:CheY-like chemotaxis protein